MLRLQVASSVLKKDNPDLDPSNFTYNIEGTPIDLGSNQYEVALAKFDSWNSFHNILEDSTIIYSLDGGSTPQTLNIPKGNYAISDINNLLQQQFFDNGEYTTNDIGLTFPITIKANFNTNRVELLFDTIGGAYTPQVDFSASNDLAEFLGFNETVISVNTVSPNIPNVSPQGTDTVNLRCSLIRGSLDNKNNSDIIHNFSPAVSPNAKLTIEPTHLLWYQVRESTISSIDFSIRNQDNEVLSLQGEDCVYTILIRPIK